MSWNDLTWWCDDLTVNLIIINEIQLFNLVIFQAGF